MLLLGEAVVQRSSVKKSVLRSFAIKKESPAQVFSCEFCEISKNTFFYRPPQVAASILDHLHIIFPSTPFSDTFFLGISQIVFYSII